MNLPKISFSRPRFSLRFFIYFLFGLIILILAVEVGYYFWTQKRQIRVNQPSIHQKGIFTYVKGPREKVPDKQIHGIVEGIDGNELTIKVESGEQVKVEYKKSEIAIAKKIAPEVSFSDIMEGDLDELLIGEEVQLLEIEEDGQGNFSAGHLVVIR